MNPLQYLQAVGRKKADATAKLAGLSPGYFNQICYGHRRASIDAANALVRASEQLAPKRKRMKLTAILLHCRENVPNRKSRARSKAVPTQE